MVQEHIISDVRKRGITLISTAEPDLCTDDPTRKLMRQIMGAISEYDKAMITLKLRAAKQRIKARGERCDGRKPYGHYSGEDHILSRIRALHMAGSRFLAIANTLNAEGIKLRSGKRWDAYSVQRILQRPTKMGASTT